MKLITQTILILFLCLSFSPQSIAQTAGTAVCMEIANIVLTAPNEFTFDVNLRNTGSSNVELRGYAGGINLTPGLENGGVGSATFLSRDASLSSIPVVTVTYSPSINHLRFTTTNAVAGNQVVLTPMLPYRLASIKVKTTTSFNPLLGSGYDPFNPVSPATPLQMQIMSGKTHCAITGFVNPSAGSAIGYTIYGTVNTASTYNIPALTGAYNGWGTCGLLPTTIQEATLNPNFIISHNESFTDLKIQSDQTFDNLTIRILNLAGEIIMEKKNLQGTYYTCDFSQHTDGMYIVEIVNAKNRVSLKFIKQ